MTLEMIAINIVIAAVFYQIGKAKGNHELMKLWENTYAKNAKKRPYDS